jgi:hypothetical protein
MKMKMMNRYLFWRNWRIIKVIIARVIIYFIFNIIK